MRRFGRGRGAPQERQTSRRARSGKLCSTLFSWVTCSSRTLLAFQGKSVVHKSCFHAGENHGLRLRSPLERGWLGFSVAAPIGPIGPTLGALVSIVQRSDLEKQTRPAGSDPLRSYPHHPYHLNWFSISSSQSGRLSTSRGRLPSGGPMMPSRCIISRIRAARP